MPCKRVLIYNVPGKSIRANGLNSHCMLNWIQYFKKDFVTNGVPKGDVSSRLRFIVCVIEFNE